jgi:hypothetical protein
MGGIGSVGGMGIPDMAAPSAVPSSNAVDCARMRGGRWMSITARRCRFGQSVRAMPGILAAHSFQMVWPADQCGLERSVLPDG